jgi:hypothetical protein
MRPRGNLPALVTVLALLASLPSLAACKRSPDPAPPDEHHHDWTKLPPAGASVKVSLAGKSADVTLSSLPADGAPPTVSFAQLWKAAWPAEDPAALHFNFVGSDGFRPSSKPKCARPLTGRELASARLDVATHDLLLAGAPDLPGCYRVHAVVAIEAAR